jgi:hypothetical protein
MCQVIQREEIIPFGFGLKKKRAFNRMHLKSAWRIYENAKLLFGDSLPYCVALYFLYTS